MAANVEGVQLSGRFAWGPGLTAAARRYTREPNAGNARELTGARERAVSEFISLQTDLGLEFLTDGGLARQDLFSPYLASVDGVREAGNIDRYPGTRNSYYHIPQVNGRIRPAGSAVEETVSRSGLPPGRKSKAILPSPLSFALACENTFYSGREKILRDFCEVLREEVSALASAGCRYIQVTECFATDPRFKGKATSAMVQELLEGLERVFEGFGGRSALYFHSGDCSEMLPKVIESGLTDVGFDFNTPVRKVRGLALEKNLLLGVQDTTRKLPHELLELEPRLLADSARKSLSYLGLSNAKAVLCPSQDYDGLQTYSQAVTRLRNLAKAYGMLEDAN